MPFFMEGSSNMNKFPIDMHTNGTPNIHKQQSRHDVMFHQQSNQNSFASMKKPILRCSCADNTAVDLSCSERLADRWIAVVAY